MTRWHLLRANRVALLGLFEALRQFFVVVVVDLLAEVYRVLAIDLVCDEEEEARRRAKVNNPLVIRSCSLQAGRIVGPEFLAQYFPPPPVHELIYYHQWLLGDVGIFSESSGVAPSLTR